MRICKKCLMFTNTSHSSLFLGKLGGGGWRGRGGGIVSCLLLRIPGLSRSTTFCLTYSISDSDSIRAVDPDPDLRVWINLHRFFFITGTTTNYVVFIGNPYVIALE